MPTPKTHNEDNLKKIDQINQLDTKDQIYICLKM